MKLIIAIVQDEDAGRLVSALMDKGFGVTKLATTGGFLRAGNTTLISGVQDEKLEEAALTGIRQTKAVLALQAQDMNPQEIAETLRLPVETVCRILEEPAYTPEDRTEQD